jgi:hypothetical protein
MFAPRPLRRLLGAACITLGSPGPATVAGKRQFRLLRIGGPGPARTLVLEGVDAAGTSLWRHEIPFAALRHPRAAP